jgi:hypothetical protein
VAELDSVIVTRVRELGEMEPKEAIQHVIEEFLKYVPQTMFLLVPVFAGLLKLLYIRQKRLYVEHFVFALHVHAFVFLTMGLTLIEPISFLQPFAMLWMVVYGYLAMHRVYGQGWFMTGVKYMTAGLSYLLLLTLAFVVTLVITLALM